MINGWAKRTATRLAATLGVVTLTTGLALASGHGAQAADGFDTVPDAPIGRAAVHQVTLVLVAPGGVEPDFSLQQAIASVEQVDRFYDRETDGFIRFEIAKSVDWTALPDVDCADFGAVNAFSESLSGFQRGPDKHLLTLVPGGGPCGGTALGGQGSDVNSGELVFQPGIDPTTIAHELGHNMSIAHASSVGCTNGWDYDNRSPRPEGCTYTEYGDLYDNMGGGYSFWPASPGTLDRLGLIDNRLVPLCGAPRTTTISTLSAGYSAERIISWTDPTAPQTEYFVAYRDKIDNEAYRDVYRQSGLPADYHVSGVTVSKSNESIARLSASVLERPGDTSDRRQLVQPEETLALAGGATVTVDSFDEVAHTATVTVDVPCSTLPATPTVTASYTSPDASTSAVIDGDLTGGGWWSWPQVGETWVQLTWPEEVAVDGAAVRFASDAGDDENRGLIPPRSWSLQYLDQSGDWVPVDSAGAFDRERDAFNTVLFAPVRTTALRAVMQAWGAAEYGGSSGIREFRASATRAAAVDPSTPVIPGTPAQPVPGGPLVPDRAVNPSATVPTPARLHLAATGVDPTPALATGVAMLMAAGACLVAGTRLRRREEEITDV